MSKGEGYAAAIEAALDEMQDALMERRPHAQARARIIAIAKRYDRKVAEASVAPRECERCRRVIGSLCTKCRGGATYKTDPAYDG